MSDDARRQAALSLMLERFPAVSQKVLELYGLRLPRHLAVFCALWESVNAQEREALNDLMVSPFGLTEFFGDDGLRLTGRDGLDARLHGRFRQDPAEFVTVLMGGSDGLHYGLWYDDPAELPSFVVYNWARDSAETWTSRRPTLLAELRDVVNGSISDYGDDSGLEVLLSALDWFAEADREALEADGESRWASVTRLHGAISVFPALPPKSGDPRLAQAGERLSCFKAGLPAATEWIIRAHVELAGGKPALALAVGGELHWLDRDEFRQQSRDLLVGAYRALGRDVLAEIAEIHAEHRDLRSVEVLIKPE